MSSLPMSAPTTEQLRQLAIFRGTQGARTQDAILRDRTASVIATAARNGLRLVRASELKQ